MRSCLPPKYPATTKNNLAFFDILVELPVYKIVEIHQNSLAKMHHCVIEEKQINIHCRSKCEETSDNSNCCAFLQYKADNTSLQIQKLDASGRNVYKFNYKNDSLQ